MNGSKTLKGSHWRQMGRVAYLLLTGLTVTLLFTTFSLLETPGFSGWHAVELGAWLPFSNVFDGWSKSAQATIR